MTGWSWVYEPPASRCACRVPLLLTQKWEGWRWDAPFVLRTFPPWISFVLGGGNPAARPSRHPHLVPPLNLPLIGGGKSGEGEGRFLDALGMTWARHPPAFAALRVPLRFSKGDVHWLS